MQAKIIAYSLSLDGLDCESTWEIQVPTEKRRGTKSKPKAAKANSEPSAACMAIPSPQSSASSEGVSTAHVRAIMKAKGVKVSDTIVSIQVNAGRNKGADRGKPADLTSAQLKQLLSAASDPAKADDAKK